MTKTLTLVTLKRLSICPCGFSTLRDGIAVGSEYEIDLERTSVMGYLCGGCGVVQDVTWVWTAAKGESQGGMLPKGIFE